MYKILALSLVAGALGALFCRGLIILDKLRRSMRTAWSAAGFALVCAFLFAGTVLLFGPQSIGSGHLLLEEYLFAPEVDATASNVGARVFGSMFSFSAGGAGGIFAPSLASGAAVGGWIAEWFSPTRGQFNLLVLAGMTAFLTGVTRSPFTSAIIVLEMTDRHSAIFQLMYAAMVGHLISFTIDRKSYYERMKERLLKALPDWPPKPERSAQNGVRRESGGVPETD
jgi:H+/Cl- antiporter ClcA